MESKLNLNMDLVAQARASAAKIADDVQEFIDVHTTVAVERTVCRLLGIDGVNDMDVPRPNVVVDHLQEKGLLAGYGDGSFQPNNAISQQEIVSILAKLSTQLNMYPYNRRNLSPTDEVMAEFAHFSDWAQHAAWLLDSCEVDISPLTTPQDGATRGLAAELICQLLVQTGILWQQH